MSISGIVVYGKLPRLLAPYEDMGNILIFGNGPQNSSFEEMNSISKDIEQEIKSTPELESYLTRVPMWSSNSIFSLIKLTDFSSRKLSSQQIAQQINIKLSQIPGATIYANPPPPPLAWYGGHSGDGVRVALMTTSDYSQLNASTEKLKEQLNHHPLITEVTNEITNDNQQYVVELDHQHLQQLNIPVTQLNETIHSLLAGSSVSKFEFSGQEYDVLVGVNLDELTPENLLENLFLRTPQGKMVSLDNVAELKIATGQSQLFHRNKLHADLLTIKLAPELSFGQGIQLVEELLNNYLPQQIHYSFVDDAKAYLENSNAMLFACILGFIFIYLTLAALYESFTDPLIILISVPFALVGAAWTLYGFGLSLNIYSQIGMITLIGLIAKHGILIVDFANHLEPQIIGYKEAVTKAATLRLRPILMTSSAMILGALPLALSMGPGHEVREQIGWTLVGGLLVGSFFSLFIVPLAYTFLAPLKKRFSSSSRKEKPASAQSAIF